MKRITLGLKDKDIENINYIKTAINGYSKLMALTFSLTLAKLIIEAKIKGNKIIKIDSNGNKKELFIQGM